MIVRILFAFHVLHLRNIYILACDATFAIPPVSVSKLTLKKHKYTNSNDRFSNTFPSTKRPRLRQGNLDHNLNLNLNLDPSKNKHRSKRIGFSDVVRNAWRRNRRARIISQRLQTQQCVNIPRGGSSYRRTRGGAVRVDTDPNSKSKNRTMYIACLAVTLTWIATGTIFYSKFNSWPLPQSFFYAVDAGMSIGFCTDVAETTIGSRAFTIVFILLGASCVGGALALFIKDIMEGVADLRHDKFEQLLAAHAVKRVQVDTDVGASGGGRLTYAQFRRLIEQWTHRRLSEDTFSKFCRRFDVVVDTSGRGTVSSALFVRRCHELDTLLDTAGPLYSERWVIRKAAQIWELLKDSFNGTHRIFTVFVIWISTGIWWGHERQGWDLITATHFAVSALATGGLTGPAVNAQGILPTEPAVFCGVYCLFGIPLFALTLGHYARVLVEGYVSAVEEKAVLESIVQPLDVTEFEYAKNLCSKDKYIHLSDFVVLQLLRQGKVDMRMVNLMKSQFELLDKNGSGRITAQEACRWTDAGEIDQ